MLSPRAKQRHAPVASDRVQPGLEGELTVTATPELAQGRRKGVLHDVFGLLGGAEHVSGEAEDPGGMPLESHFERRLVSPADVLDELRVAGEGQEALRVERPRREARWNRCCPHDLRVLPGTKSPRITNGNAKRPVKFAGNSQTSRWAGRLRGDEEDHGSDGRAGRAHRPVGRGRRFEAQRGGYPRGGLPV